MILSMPLAPLRPCSLPGCPELVRGRGRCPAHEQKAQADDRAVRGSSFERGYDAKWRARRKAHLERNPVCVMCLKESPTRVTPATVADHIDAHKGDKAKFDDDSNLQSLCESHHSQKTSTEDRGAWRPHRG